jgi:hypothetical protein
VRCEPVTLHTDIPTRAEVQRLLVTREPHCVSAYLPTSPISQDAQADRIELKNLVAGGRVLAVRAPDVPGGGPLAAILRYAP